MALSFNGQKRIRKTFGRIPEVAPMPNLIEVQRSSYDHFLQMGVAPEQRGNVGLQEAFRSVFPIRDFSERAQLESLAGDSPKDPVIASFRQRLVALLEPLSEAQEHVDTLYKMVVKGDAAPTAAQTVASNAADAKVTPLFATWKQLQAGLPALNKAMRAAHLGKIRADLPPPRDRNVADEE